MADKQAIRAYVRVRPFTAKEMSARPQPCIRPSGNRVLVEHEVLAQAEAETGRSTPRTGNLKDKDKESDATSSQNHTFEFDGVFWSVPPNQVLSETEAQDEYFLAALPPFASQERLFQEVGVSAVDNLLKGFPVTVFAYGQTGSGKSHSIFGPMTDPGLSPRMAMEIFKILEIEKQFGWKAEVALSCFEIYNEKVTDLLSKSVAAKPSPKGKGRQRGASMSRIKSGHFAQDFTEDVPDGGASTHSSPAFDPLSPNRGDLTPRSPRPGLTGIDEDDSESIEIASTNDAASTSHETSAHASHFGSLASSPSRANFEEVKELRVRQHPDLGVFVEGLRKEQVGDAIQLTNAIHTALNHRVTASTRMNDTSSRSHAVIQVSVDIRDEVQGKRRSAIMNIIDLAGSERISRSGVTGQQLNEAKNINLSLTTLRRVIDVITENMDKKTKNKQVPPFRESTLTWILMDCFGGSSVTIMLATASPHLDNISDTISTMRYATKCKTIVNQVRANESKIAVTIAAINAESERLRRNLKEVEGDKADNETVMKQERAKIQRKNNVIRAVIKPSHDRMRAGRDEAQRSLQEALETLEQCRGKVASKEKKQQSEEETVRFTTRNKQSKIAAELEYRTYRKIEDEITSLKSDLNDLLGIKPQSNASTFKAMRRTAIRRQIIMYAQEQRDKPIMARLREENAALLARIEGLGPLMAAIDEQIALEKRQVDIASGPERVKDAAAKELGDAHDAISVAIEGYREVTGATNRHISAEHQKEQQMEQLRKETAEMFREWHTFHMEHLGHLKDNMREVTAKGKALHEEANDQCTDYEAVRKRRRVTRDTLTMLDEEIRLERLRAAEVASQLNVVRSDVGNAVSQLRADDDERAHLSHLIQDDTASQQAIVRQSEAVQTAIRGLEHVIRTRCFPDASGLYGDRVLARMAVDLDVAAAVSPKQLERLRQHPSPYRSPRNPHTGPHTLRTHWDSSIGL